MYLHGNFFLIITLIVKYIILKSNNFTQSANNLTHISSKKLTFLCSFLQGITQFVLITNITSVTSTTQPQVCHSMIFSQTFTPLFLNDEITQPQIANSQ